LDLSSKNRLISPQTDTRKTNKLIQLLSYGNSDINDSALYFIGANNDIKTGYGWDGNLSMINKQEGSMHPIHSSASKDEFIPAISNFKSAYEYYKLAWSAYAIVYTNSSKQHMGTLTLYYDYQPWKGESYTNGKSAIIMQNVSTFQFISIGSIIKIQVCTKSDLISKEDYSLCKEKSIF